MEFIVIFFLVGFFLSTVIYDEITENNDKY